MTPDSTAGEVGTGGSSNSAALRGRGSGGGLDQGRGVVGGSGPGRLGLAGPDQLGHLDLAAPTGHAHRHPGEPGTAVAVHGPEAHHGHPTVAPDAVGRGRVVGEPDLGLADLLDDHDTPLGPARRQGPLDDLLGGAQTPIDGAHDVPTRPVP